MHILFLSHYFPPEVNAPASRTYEHCLRWVKRGHEVSIITCAPNCPNGTVYKGYRNRIRQVEYISGIRVIRVLTYFAANNGFRRRILNYVSYMFSAVIQAVFAMRGVDILVATSPQFFCGWAGVLCHWVRRWPFVLEVRDIWPESILAVGAMQRSAMIQFLEYAEKRMYESASHIVTVGEGYKQRIIKKGISPEKISVVMNGVDLKHFHPIMDTKSIREEFRSKDKFVCAYFGTVGMAHGLEVILKAAHDGCGRVSNDIKFWIVGDGARRQELENEAKRLNLDNVIFTGIIPKEKMPIVIAASDVCLVHLLGTDLFQSVIPSKIFEFMAMNLPIIMGVRGPAQDLVIDAGAGIAMIPDDPESLLKCIDYIKKQGKDSFSGREYVSSHFNRDVLADKMLGILYETASAHPEAVPVITDNLSPLYHLH